MFKMGFTVRYSETDYSGKMSMRALVSLFQDVGYCHGQSRGFGIEYSKREKHTWYLVSWRIRKINMPSVGEKITVETYIYDELLSVLKKNCIMRNQQGEVLAVAEAMWAYVDIEKGEMDSLPQGMWSEEDYGEKYELPEVSRRIQSLSGLHTDVSVLPYVETWDSMLDANMHANNARLTGVAMVLGNCDCNCVELRAEFKKQILPDGIIVPVVRHSKTTIVALQDEDGKDYALFEFVNERDV